MTRKQKLNNWYRRDGSDLTALETVALGVFEQLLMDGPCNPGDDYAQHVEDAFTAAQTFLKKSAQLTYPDDEDFAQPHDNEFE